MRRLRAVAVAAWLLGAPAVAHGAALGHPGAPTPAFSVRLSAGFAYTARDLDNKNSYRDSIRRLRLLGRVSVMALDWLEIGAAIEGADARRPLVEFEDSFDIGGGGMLRAYALNQEKHGVNMGLGGGAEFRRNKGTSPASFAAASGFSPARDNDTLKERQYHAELTMSRRFDIWALYGGLLWQWIDVREESAPTGADAFYGNIDSASGYLPVGMFVGVDYYITPVVFFTIEGQNFHEDTLAASIGVLIGGDH